MSIEINFGKVSQPKPVVFTVGKGRGFLASLTGELKKLAPNSKSARSKSDGSTATPAIAETGERIKLAEVQVIQVQGISNYGAALQEGVELKVNGESEPKTVLRGGSTAAHHSEALVSDQVKTDLIPGSATVPGAVTEDPSGPALGYETKSYVQKETEGKATPGKMQAAEPRVGEVDKPAVRERGVASKLEETASPEQERFRNVVERLERAGVQFEHMRSSIEGKPELHEALRVNIRPDRRNADLKAAYGYKTMVDHRPSDRSVVVAEVAEIPQDTKQAVSNKRASAAGNKVPEGQLNTSDGSLAGSEKSLEPNVSPEERLPASSGVHATASVGDEALLQGGREGSRPTEALAGDLKVREPVARRATGTNLFNARSVSRTDNDGRLRESQRRTSSAANRDHEKNGASANEWEGRIPEIGNQRTPAVEHQREQAQQVMKDEVGALRIDLHQPASTTGKLTREVVAEQGVNSGESHLRDGVQPGVVTPGPNPLHGAQLVQQKEHAEMHIGLRTPEGGRVEVHTVHHAGQTETIIAVEKGSVRDALLAEMPMLYSDAREHHTDIGRLTVVETGTMASFGAGNSEGRNGESRGQRFARQPAPVGAESSERGSDLEQITADGLSIHV